MPSPNSRGGNNGRRYGRQYGHSMASQDWSFDGNVTPPEKRQEKAKPVIQTAEVIAANKQKEARRRLEDRLEDLRLSKEGL